MNFDLHMNEHIGWPCHTRWWWEWERREERWQVSQRGMDHRWNF